MRLLLLAVALMLPLSCADAGQDSAPDAIRVVYSVTLDQNDVIVLSVYNPTDQTACTSMLGWPGPVMFGNTLRVTGKDGKEWEYIGPEESVVGRPKNLEIRPHSEVTVRIDVREYYKPRTSESGLGKVYFGALFRRC